MKVIIVEDEELIRKGLMKTIQWMRNDIVFVEECSNGREAVEKIRTLKPDFVITDIRMPVMDGLEMIERVRQFNPEIPFIIISGFEDFGYAKKAIRFNVEDYLLKPVDEKELAASVERTVNKVFSRSNTEESRDEYIEFSNLFKSLIYNKVSTRTGGTRFRPIEAFFVRESCAIAVIYLYDQIKEDSRLDIRQLVSIFKRTLKEGLDCKSFLFENRPGEMICMIGAGNPEAAGLKGLLQKAFWEVYDTMGFKLTIGLSRFFHQPDGVKKAYTEASNAILERLYDSENTVFLYGEEKQRMAVRPVNFDLYKKKIIESMELSNGQQMENAVDATFEELQCSHPEPLELIKGLKGILKGVQQRFSENDDMFAGVMEGYISRIEFAMGISTLEELKEQLKKVLNETMNLLLSGREEESRRIIERAKKIIKASCFEDISLKRVAEGIQMSPAYFSHLFKKETGMNFVDYVTEVKMEKAKELLVENPEMKIYEIAYNLGYQDVKYFNRVFKKIYSQTPGELREKLLD